MADAAATDAPTPRRSRFPLLIGVVLALAAAGGGYFAVTSGLLFGTGSDAAEGHGSGLAGHGSADELAPVAFVAIEPLMVSLGAGAPGEHLRFEGHLEIVPGQTDAVSAMMPRIMDVLNGYLRAVEYGDLRDPAALIRLRAQMLRRIQVVTGEGRVKDLLITQFLIS